VLGLFLAGRVIGDDPQIPSAMLRFMTDTAMASSAGKASPIWEGQPSDLASGHVADESRTSRISAA